MFSAPRATPVRFMHTGSADDVMRVRAGLAQSLEKARMLRTASAVTLAQRERSHPAGCDLEIKRLEGDISVCDELLPRVACQSDSPASLPHLLSYGEFVTGEETRMGAVHLFQANPRLRVPEFFQAYDREIGKHVSATADDSFEHLLDMLRKAYAFAPCSQKEAKANTGQEADVNV